MANANLPPFQLVIKPVAVVTLVVLVLVTWQSQLSASAAIVFAILVHETAHACAALLVGCGVRKFVVGLFPAFHIENPHHRGKNAWIALAAPTVNFALFFVFGFAHCWIFATAQLLVGILAVLPYPRSDSWRACKATL